MHFCSVTCCSPIKKQSLKLLLLLLEGLSDLLKQKNLVEEIFWDFQGQIIRILAAFPRNFRNTHSWQCSLSGHSIPEHNYHAMRVTGSKERSNVATQVAHSTELTANHYGQLPVLGGSHLGRSAQLSHQMSQPQPTSDCSCMRDAQRKLPT